MLPNIGGDPKPRLLFDWPVIEGLPNPVVEVEPNPEFAIPNPVLVVL